MLVNHLYMFYLLFKQYNLFAFFNFPVFKNSKRASHFIRTYGKSARQKTKKTKTKKQKIKSAIFWPNKIKLFILCKKSFDLHN